MKTMINAVDKAFVKEIYERIDSEHKDALRRVDYQYRSLKDSIEQWSKNEDGLVTLSTNSVLRARKMRRI
jgi:hypothetical protein